jgi:DNA-binding NarL/FixJ family response regulator
LTATASIAAVVPADATGFANRRILVVDGHEIVCAGLRALLCQQKWVERCIGATDRETACKLAFRYEPHVALIDLLVAGQSGVEIGEAVRQSSPATRLIFMSDSGRISALALRAAGAQGFIGKDWDCASILAAVRRATLGRPVFLSAATTGPRVGLSVRERDVLRQLVLGATNPEAASRLNLSPHTIKQHTSAVYRKLGVRNRTEAVSRAHSLGLID